MSIWSSIWSKPELRTFCLTKHQSGLALRVDFVISETYINDKISTENTVSVKSGPYWENQLVVEKQTNKKRLCLACSVVDRAWAYKLYRYK